MRQKLEEAITACTTLIELMQSTDLTVQEEAVDAARGMLWRWVDEGNATELLNLIGAIRLVTKTSLDHLEDE